MKKSTKKLFSILLALVLALGVLSITSFAAGAKLTYVVNEFGQAVLKSCGTDAKGTVTIDSKVTIDGKEYEVKAIGDEAFKGCNSVTRITIPEGVKTIGVKAFAGCQSLNTVDIQKTLIKCDYDAFVDCGTVTVNCYKSNYQFFAVYGFGDNLKINILDDDLDEQQTTAVNSIVEFIRQLILKILSWFGIVPANR